MDKFYDALFNAPLGAILTTLILGLYLLSLYSVFVKIKKRISMIYIGVVATNFFIVLLREELDIEILFNGLRLGAWEYLLVTLDGTITIILSILIYYFAIKYSSRIRNIFNIVICPHCGEWNEYEEISCEDIYDNFGNKIGYDCTSRCTKCREEFEHTFLDNDSD